MKNPPAFGAAGGFLRTLFHPWNEIDRIYPGSYGLRVRYTEFPNPHFCNMERDEMSERAIAWAETARATTPAQRKVLLYLAQYAADDGTVRGGFKLLEDFSGTLTPAQAKRAAEALVLARTMTLSWDADRYVWDFHLQVPA